MATPKACPGVAGGKGGGYGHARGRFLPQGLGAPAVASVGWGGVGGGEAGPPAAAPEGRGRPRVCARVPPTLFPHAAPTRPVVPRGCGVLLPWALRSVAPCTCAVVVLFGVLVAPCMPYVYMVLVCSWQRSPHPAWAPRGIFSPTRAFFLELGAEEQHGRALGRQASAQYMCPGSWPGGTRPQSFKLHAHLADLSFALACFLVAKQPPRPRFSPSSPCPLPSLCCPPHEDREGGGGDGSQYGWHPLLRGSTAGLCCRCEPPAGCEAAPRRQAHAVLLQHHIYTCHCVGRGRHQIRRAEGGGQGPCNTGEGGGGLRVARTRRPKRALAQGGGAGAVQETGKTRCAGRRPHHRPPAHVLGPPTRRRSLPRVPRSRT